MLMSAPGVRVRVVLGYVWVCVLGYVWVCVSVCVCVFCVMIHYPERCWRSGSVRWTVTTHWLLV